jgi:hypothetical protein
MEKITQKNHSYYYLSNGQGQKIYTLRHRQGGFEYNGRWIAEQNIHIQNLSRDYDTALEKGKKIAQDNNARFESHPETMDLNDYGVHFRGYNFNGKTLCYGVKYKGYVLANLVSFEDGVRYLAEGYGFPSKPCIADIECRDYVQNLPEIKAYHKAKEDEIKEIKKQEDKLTKKIRNSEHIASVGDSIEIDVRIVDKRWFDGMYGRSCCLNLEDMDKNQIVCFSSAKWVSELTDEDMDKKIRISAIVKKHNKISSHKINHDLRFLASFDVMQTQLKNIKILKGSK